MRDDLAEQRIAEAWAAEAERLDLYELDLQELPASLSELPKLQDLDLEFCQSLTDLTSLAGLRELQTLDLKFCRALTDLTPLAGLRKLQWLDLRHTGVTDLAPLAGLRELQTLHLSWTGVQDLTPLAGLERLRRLHLDDCKGLTDISPLAGLQGLRSLDLSRTRVADLSPLAALHGLETLRLSGTRVTDLSLLTELRKLEKLDLGDCPPVPARLLRALARLPRLTRLVANEATGVPKEAISIYWQDDCLVRLRNYLYAENEVKVILLGDSGTGKTQLCRRFRGQPFDESIPPTRGVQLWREDLRIRTGGPDEIFRINWWDFGGRDIDRETRAFLRTRAIFLVLWTPRLERLTDWLDDVRTLAGEDSLVIVVQSQCDRFADRRPAPARPDGFGFFECCAYSAKTNYGHSVLEGYLYEAIESLPKRNRATKIGQGRIELRHRLDDLRREDQQRTPEERQHRILTLETFRALCDEVGGIASWERALAHLHDTGVVFYQPDLFSGCIVLDQDWILDAIFTP